MDVHSVTTDDMLAAHRRVFDGLNAADWTPLETLVAEDHVLHQGVLPMFDPKGWAPVVALLKYFMHALKGMELEVVAQLGEGDTAVTRFRGRARNLGNFGVVPPSQRDVVITGVLESRFDVGHTRLLESWLQVNAFEIAFEIGAVAWCDPVRHVMS